ncbi:hypothetical protein KK137_14465 [Croceibacterium sp. LX-88]|jgi:hypothetical protein|uniref:Uncharacterized protein n=1 Tax=Croceibacterium selenioxidans TaxID=2838833 RepID=A0ABS5W8B5_9SPHN|nr:hypothetical protein [Croceibacterium selenioxidans]MBT2135538.1 hypothetical protein [Croceibacterium selenioxidans]
MWTLHKQQQQRGVQLRTRKSGEAPVEAVKDREAQDHEQAGMARPKASKAELDTLPLPEGK